MLRFVVRQWCMVQTHELIVTQPIRFVSLFDTDMIHPTEKNRGSMHPGRIVYFRDCLLHLIVVNKSPSRILTENISERAEKVLRAKHLTKV